MSAGEQIYWRGVFNAWHIGLGGHINIQHYAQALDDARAIAGLRLGVGPAELRERGLCLRPVADRIDFRKELVPGDATRIAAVAGRADGGRAALNGSMLAEPDGGLVMRFETRFGLIDTATGDPVDWQDGPKNRIDALRALRPISEPHMPSVPPQNAWTTWQGTVEVRDSDHHGLMSPRAVYDVITRALWAINIRMGLHRDQMHKAGSAGGVSAIQVRHGRPARMGDLLEVRTSLLGIGTNSLRMGHLIRNQISGERVAQVEYVNTFFSRTTGRKQPPDPDYLEGVMAMRLPE